MKNEAVCSNNLELLSSHLPKHSQLKEAHGKPGKINDSAFT